MLLIKFRTWIRILADDVIPSFLLLPFVSNYTCFANPHIRRVIQCSLWPAVVQRLVIIHSQFDVVLRRFHSLVLYTKLKLSSIGLQCVQINHMQSCRSSITIQQLDVVNNSLPYQQERYQTTCLNYKKYYVS